MELDVVDVENFLKAIVKVCEKHKMVLTTSGYDELQVWKLDNKQDLELILGADDRTEVGQVVIAPE